MLELIYSRNGAKKTESEYDTESERRKESEREMLSTAEVQVEPTEEELGEKKEKSGNNGLGYSEFRLPKNIRQIGTPNPTCRIYMEDYVITYLTYIGRPGSTGARGALLLGEVQHTERGEIIFINGAVDADQIEFDLDDDTFSKDNWTKLRALVQENFPELSIVGWYLNRMGFSVALNERMENLHRNHFPGKDKILFLYDSLDEETACYMCRNGDMEKQEGYYIYYAKNQPMQDYIIRQKGEMALEEEDPISEKDKNLVQNFREVNEKYANAEETDEPKLSAVIGVMAVVAVLAVGAVIYNNFDRMRDMESTLNRLMLTNNEKEVSTENYVKDILEDLEGKNADLGAKEAMIKAENAQSTDGTEGDRGNEENPSEGNPSEVLNPNQINPDDLGVDGREPEGANLEGIDPSGLNAGQEKEVPQEEKKEEPVTVMSGDMPVYYEIQPGDTLSKIALAKYASLAYVDLIAKANNISAEDKIYIGQKIILPPKE